MCEAHYTRRSEYNAAEVGRLVEELITSTKQDRYPVRVHPRPEVFAVFDLRQQTVHYSTARHDRSTTNNDIYSTGRAKKCSPVKNLANFSRTIHR